MAPFLRASLHNLRSSLCSQRERCLLKLPESKYVIRRWYGETAISEESSSAANDAAGENAASIDASSLSKSSEGVDNQGLTSSMKPDNESPTDKLTSLILGKMRSRNNPSSEKQDIRQSFDNLQQAKGTDFLEFTRSTSSKAAKPTEDANESGTDSLEFTRSTSSKAAKPTEEANESVRGDKWEQVLGSMRNMAAKRREQMAKSNTKPAPPKLQDTQDPDDFADLDSPAGDLAKAISDLPAFMQRESGFQAPNMKQKAKEAKTVSFSFLKALDNDTSTTRPQSSGAHSFSDGNVGFSPSSKPKDNGLNGLMQSTKKEPKPLSFDFLKAPEMKSGSPLGAHTKTSDSARLFSVNDKRELSTPLGSAGVPARTPSFDQPKQESNNSMPTLPSGYVVCVHNLPSHSNLALIKEALSIHGEVVSSFKKPDSNGSCSAFIEFKMSEAMDEALTVRWLQIDSKSFGIVRADSPITTVVRLSRVSASTTDTQVQAMCEKFGNLDQIRKRGNGVYDVFFKTGELSNMFAILDSLNEVTLNQRRWVALPAPLLHPGVRREVLKGGEGQAWHAQQLSQTLGRLEMGLEAVSVYFEDLKALVAMEDDFTK
ncbi:hypothetical protein L7F22_056641 [Adiantum nelumboides]|nr:hypothetical protein [Adiantum nelumboides]